MCIDCVFYFSFKKKIDTLCLIYCNILIVINQEVFQIYIKFMNKKILFVPLDERPCNWLFPQKLIQCIDGFELLEPTKEMLGNKKTPSNFALLKDFIFQNIKEANAAVISIDQLLYGGIVPSRIHNLSLDELKERLMIIKEIKKINPNIILYCFVLIMRCPKYSSSDEEPDYYEIYGEKINKIGSLIERGEDYSFLLNDELKTSLEDYIERRKKNLCLIKETINLLNGSIDYLLIPQDDSQTEGFTMMDRKEVLNLIQNSGFKNIDLYPGADEIGLTLLSRAINNINNSSKKIYLDFLYEESESLIPAYENKPLLDTIKHHINASGNTLVGDIDDSDIVLFLNYDKNEEQESSNPVDNLNETDILSQIKRMKSAKNKGKTTSLVDKFYVNGGNLKYMEVLSNHMNIDDLDVYSGWNTSSNSLGTAISFSTTISYQGKTIESTKFLAERIYDDLIYQALIRRKITSETLPSLNLNYFDIRDKQKEVESLTKDALEEYAEKHFKAFYSKHQIKYLEMPWKRMFEIFLEVKS